MLLRPSKKSLKTIAHYCGLLTSLIGFLMIIPLITALMFSEFDSAVNFLIGISLTIIFGSSLMFFTVKVEDVTWSEGLVIVALTWIFAMLFSAIPLYLSGHFKSYLDATFDTMSGFATTGLALIQNLDHASESVNMWRHLIMFIGGQGIIVVGLTFLVKLPGAGGAFEMYAGEAREEKILPHVRQTTRFIWKVSLAYLLIGVLALTPIFIYEGMPFIRSLFHSMWIFMAAWDTGGFAPQSQNILYYHSQLVEIITVIFMIGGGLSFGMHYALWNARRSEIWKNIEAISLFISIIILTVMIYISLWSMEFYLNSSQLFRKGFYQLVSAHTGTGYQTVYPSELSSWGSLAILAIIIAMGFGASASSTAGGIKMLRIGLLFKLFIQESKRIVLPESAVIVEKYHVIKDLFIQDKLIRMCFLITCAYIFSYIAGAGFAMYYGYPFHQALFESTSAAANVGLSSGITSPDMPNMLKVVYIIQMWTGRLEFMSIFAIGGTIIALIKGK